MLAHLKNRIRLIRPLFRCFIQSSKVTQHSRSTSPPGLARIFSYILTLITDYRITRNRDYGFENLAKVQTSFYNATYVVSLTSLDSELAYGLKTLPNRFKRCLTYLVGFMTLRLYQIDYIYCVPLMFELFRLKRSF